MTKIEPGTSTTSKHKTVVTGGGGGGQTKLLLQDGKERIVCYTQKPTEQIPSCWANSRVSHAHPEEAAGKTASS